MSSNSGSEVDALVGGQDPSYSSTNDATGSLPRTFHTKDHDVSQLNPYGDANLEHAANNLYEAVIDDDHNDTNKAGQNSQAFDPEEQDEDVVWLREQRDSNKLVHWFKRPSVYMVGVYVFVISFAISSGESTRQLITLKLACNYLTYFSPEGHCDATGAQVLVSNLQMCYSIFGGLTMMFASGKVAPLSDQYGRLIFLRLGIGFLLLAKISRFFLMYTSPYLRFNLMVLTEVVGNLCGGTIALMSITNCYISDVVDPHQRIYSLGINIACFFTGFSTGPLVGNWLLRLANSYNPSSANENGESEFITHSLFGKDSSIHHNEFVPLKFELVLLFAAAVFVLFVIPESRSAKARRKSRSLSRSSSSSSLRDLRQSIAAGDSQQQSLLTTHASRLFNLVNFLRPIRLLFYPEDVVNPVNHHRIKRDRAVVIILALIECSLSSIGMSLMEVNILYGLFKFNWESADIGHLLAISCATKAVALLVLSPIINHTILQRFCRYRTLKNQFDMIDFWIAFSALFLESIGLTMLAFAPSTAWFFASFLFTCFGSLASPSINSSIIKFYPESKVGEVFGGMALLRNFFSLAVPTLVLTVYKTSLSHWNIPYLVFLFVASLMFVMALLIVAVKRLLYLSKDSNPQILTRSNSVVSFNRPFNPSDQLNDGFEQNDGAGSVPASPIVGSSASFSDLTKSRSGSFHAAAVSSSPVKSTQDAKILRKPSVTFSQNGFNR